MGGKFMKSIVLYKSKYGSTKKYAEWISQALNCEQEEFGKLSIESLKNYDNIICGQGIYAGNFSVAKDLAKIIERYPNKNYVFFSVSISDPKLEKDKNNLMESVNKSFGNNRDEIKVFLLRGDYYFSKMSIKDKLMMWMLVKYLKRKPESEKTNEDRYLIEKYKQSIEFSNQGEIVDLVDYIKGLDK